MHLDRLSRTAALLTLGVTLTAGAAEPVTVLRAAHLYDGKADTVVSPGVVVVSEGRIVAAGSNAHVPAGARVLDWGTASGHFAYFLARCDDSIPRFQCDSSPIVAVLLLMIFAADRIAVATRASDLQGWRTPSARNSWLLHTVGSECHP